LGEPGGVRPPALDLGAFNQLTGGDAEFAADLARSFLDNSRELYGRVRGCVFENNREQLARWVHQLAGASANVHAAPLRELCLSLERVASTATTTEVEDFITRIGAELARIETALRSNAAAEPV
jgi:HPt (histidine-containing phosphotransfer) domain-containing protein